ncbi:uncharacterized protein [Anabrus simplex]|uniref:uncharacterized protein n=1 Tax=Anabrus simplex TaxID=316456 RepID=UPI0035A37E04
MQYLWKLESVAESPPSALSDRSQLQMISFSLDPQWCGLLFSVYFRHEKPGLLGPDAFATCSLAGPQWDSDWIAFAGSFGFEICRISSTWAVIFDTVKTSGVILLLGVGSLVCYKLYHYYWPRSRSRLNSPSSSPPHAKHSDGCLSLHRTDDNQLVEDIDEEDISNIEAQYFGPNPVPYDNKTNGNFNAARCFENSRLTLDQDVLFSPENGSSGEDESFDVDMPDNYHKRKMHHLEKIIRQRSSCPRSQRQYLLQSWESVESVGKNPSWLVKRLGDVLTTPPREQQLLHCGSVSLPVTPGRLFKNSYNHNTKRKDLLDRRQHWKHNNLPAEEEERILQALKSLNQCVPQARSNPSDESNSTVNTGLCRDESYDSLGFSRTIPREGSFDSTCSEMSLDFSLPEATVATSTMMYLESLQQEIDQLKDNCLMMDEEFETIKCNRNLPGMSSLMKAKNDSTHASETADEINHNDVQEIFKEDHARACFAGLYSLTTIKHSTSSELSDSLAANGRGSIGSTESLQWDSPKPEASPVKCTSLGSPQSLNKYVLESNLIRTGLHPDIITDSEVSENTSGEDDLMAKLEWDEDGLLEYCPGDLEGDNDLMSMEIPQIDMQAEFGFQATPVMNTCGVESMTSNEMCIVSSFTERSTEIESSGIECSMTNSATTMASSMFSNNCDQKICPSFSWSSDESGYMDWDKSSVKQTVWPQAQQSWSEISALARCNNRSHSISSNSASEQSTPVGEILSSRLTSPCSEPVPPEINSVENIGHKLNIIEYASQEWKGKTRKAETILKGYAEIPSKLGVKYLRKIRGDNYCGVRATIFQALAQGLPIPNGAHTFKCLCHALHDEGCSWLQDWTFAGRLPYRNSNVLHGMENCLRSLDNVASLLSSSEDRGETLAAILNSDHSLDLHVVEAVKLHMLVSAKELYKASTSGADIPLFALLMFARDTSETPRDLMNNHLREVGNVGGLEQVEMFLLGYTLGVTIQVVRPSAYGTEDFVCYYPDWNVGSRPQVLVVAEDDRHYNVLVD